MSGTILRWGLPALLTVVGGTLAAVLTTGATMTADLSTRGSAALSGDNHWASVRFDGRDAILTGTATDQAMIDKARQRVAELHGVRSVTDAVVLAEYVSPFPLEARVEQGALRLSGGVPDETAHAELLLASGAAADELRLMSGAPERAKWLAASRYAIDFASRLDDGAVRLADLELSIDGRAKSQQAFDELQRMLAVSPPEGVALQAAQIAPPLATPYTWSARFDGEKLSISGYMPEESFLERLKIADIGGRPVATSLQLASGAPQGFEDNALALLQNLMQLEYGEVSVSDAQLTLKGAPPDAETAEKVRVAMQRTGAQVTLEPRRVHEFLLQVTAASAGLTLTGFLPDQAAKDRLGKLDKIDLTAVELARGAPERFESGVDFAIDVARHLGEGVVRVEGTSISIEGRAATLADFNALTNDLKLGAPQGLVLRKAEILPPIAVPFLWAAEKAPDGSLALTGYVTSETQRTAQREAAAGALDQTTLADGEPAGFEDLSLAGLNVLARLDTGRVSYDGEIWSVAGKVDTAQKAFAAQAAFDAAGLRAAGWDYAVELPRPIQAAPLPVIDPYSWRAQKSPDGAVTFTGFLPTEVFKKFLARRVGDSLRDNSALGAGAPENFIANALAGLDALLGLDEGALSFAEGKWALAGETPTVTTRARLEDELVAAVDESQWTIALKALDAAPLVSPFTWAAIKADNGRVALSGYVTTDELRRFVAVRAGDVVSDRTELASGEPAGFMADVLAGLEALSHLQSGSVRFDGTTFSLVGVPTSPANRVAALAALEAATAAGAGWRTDVAEPITPELAAPAEPPVDLLPEAPLTDVAAVPQAPVAEPVVTPEPAPEPALPLEPAAPAAEPAPQVASAPEPEVAPEPARAAIFAATKQRGAAIALTGAVPADAARRYFGVVAGDVRTDAMTVASDLPKGFIDSAVIGLRTLAALDSGSLAYDGAGWQLSGAATDDAARQAALAALAAVPGTAEWQTNLTLMPPVAVCQDKVAAFAARNAILFQSGSATITAESQAALDELAGYLQSCREATVHVEGHTDADGDEQLNLALSVMRAEAVVEALIERGVAFDHLYAVGYGESLPIADNATASGKQANRRIAFTVLDEHQ